MYTGDFSCLLQCSNQQNIQLMIVMKKERGCQIACEWEGGGGGGGGEW